jgi:hypothetical protein
MTKKKSTEAPLLGIFWLVNGKLVIDSTPLNEAEPYGEHRTHPRSHIDTWTQYQRIGKVPHESEYEEFPRGRVMHHPKSGEFTILADKCILARKDLIAHIKDALHLPAKTKIGTDPHYRCFFCLYGSDVDDDLDE